jgi:hypothetical protein
MSLFYVGGTFTRYEEVRSVVDRLAALGHECAHDWTRQDQDFDGSGRLKDSAKGGYDMQSHWPHQAELEIDAIRRVGAAGGFTIFLGEEASRGWVTEFGMAIAFNVPRIAVVNPFKVTVFDALPNVVLANSVDEAIERVAGVEWIAS